VPTLNSRDHAFIDLAGMAQIKENLFNANLFWMPFENLSILSGFRYTHQNNDSESTFIAEEPVPNTPPFTPNNPQGGFHYGVGEPANGARNSDYNFAQRLEIRYTGIKDWLFWIQGEWEEDYGSVNEFQTIDEEVPLDKNTMRLAKYTRSAPHGIPDEIQYGWPILSQNCVLQRRHYQRRLPKIGQPGLEYR
jgi:hypothetical protein